MHLENLISNLNNELENMKNSIKECLRNTKLNKDDITVREFSSLLIKFIVILRTSGSMIKGVFFYHDSMLLF